MPVDRRAGDGDRQPGAQERASRDVAAGCAFLHRAAEDHVFDQLRLDAGALHGILDRMCCQGRTVRVVQPAAIRPADGCAGGRHDDGFRHGTPVRQWSGSIRTPLQARQIRLSASGFDGKTRLWCISCQRIRRPSGSWPRRLKEDARDQGRYGLSHLCQRTGGVRPASALFRSSDA